MLAPSGGGLILYQAYDNLYAMTGFYVVCFQVLQIVAGDGVASIKQSCRDLSSDGVKNLATTSRRGRLKEDLESSTWRRRQDYKATPLRRHLFKYKSVFKALIPDLSISLLILSRELRVGWLGESDSIR
ncbi:hypothetical protein Tco_0305500 [Tanacetum coccineum]